MSDIQEKIAFATKGWNVDEIVNAVIADDPEAVVIKDSLTDALEQTKKGYIARERKINLSSIVETRIKSGLTQDKFANTLGISVNTLRSWEQGVRKPSGAAATLLRLLEKRPELVAELSF
ncbi:helix-turn-helix domain-containing protein [Avibacterium sp. 21-599]|uniref:helix-turn-helix domain-containing protein n=1 Tax=Avibacterium sp. 21-599 TaxID=2911528 RepID=UPI00224785D2|nr:type II toxin-antitoxin system MqsA family antitoxin [Avibacterium sp. 21-599]MCW9717793.1 type II toxin-antitoxin system MqsA family antitoxin [Avibacterium sp. 21-599]